MGGEKRRFDSFLLKHLIHIKHNLYINPSDPLYYEKVLQYANPHCPEAHYMLGKKCELAGKWSKALFHYEKSTDTYSHYYYDAVQAVERIKKQIDSQPGTSLERPEKKPWLVITLVSTLVLLIVVLVLLLFQVRPVHPNEAGEPHAAASSLELAKEQPSEQDRSVKQTADQPGEPALPVPRAAAGISPEFQDRQPLLAFGTNLVRTALQTYIAQHHHAPAQLADLVRDYPNNYLSFIPLEPLSGSNRVFAHFTGQGGWVYDSSAGDISRMFYPNLDPSHPAIPFEPVEIWIWKEQHRLELRSGSTVVLEKTVGLGKDNRTPEGRFEIVERVRQPLGKRPNMYGVAGLGMGRLAIHGTYEESSIGANQSWGCIRLFNGDMEELFSFVPKGTAVTIRPGEPPSGERPGESRALRAARASGSWTTPAVHPLIRPSAAGVNERTGTVLAWLG